MRASIRDWITMTVLAHWLSKASAPQVIALGSDLVGRGVFMQTGRANIVTVDVSSINPSVSNELDGVPVGLSQKWVA
jgi:hypothetical protein